MNCVHQFYLWFLLVATHSLASLGWFSFGHDMEQTYEIGNKQSNVDWIHNLDFKNKWNQVPIN